MSILSKITSGIKTIGSTIVKALTAPISSSSQTASALQGTLIPGSLQKAQQNSAAKTSNDLKTLGLGTTQGSGITTSFKNLMSSPGTGIPNNPNPAPALPVTISSAKSSNTSSSGGTSFKSLMSSSGSGSQDSFNIESLAPSGPTTISSSSFGSSGVSSLGAGSGGGQALSLSSAPSSVNPTNDNTKLSGPLAGYYEYDNATGQFKAVKDQGQESDLETANRYKDLYDEIVGKKQNVNDDPEVIAARDERRRAQEALLGPTSELNSIIAKQNQDLIQLRKTGAQEGVTEVVYGNQSNTINYNAAIQALPLKAHIAALQDNLELAQDYLTELTKIKTEQITSQYEYNKGLFNAILPALEKKDQRAYEAITKKNERDYQEQKDLIETQKDLLATAYQMKAPKSVIDGISNARNSKEAVIAAGTYAAKASTQIVEYGNGHALIDSNTGKVISVYGGKASEGFGDGDNNISDISQAVLENPSLYYNFTPTQKAQIVSELKRSGYDISGLQNSKLSASQQEDVGQMNTVDGLIDKVLAYNADGSLEGIGPFGLGSVKSLAAQFGAGTQEGMDVRALIGNIKGTIAKLRGGTSFTPNEQTLLDTYTPTINDNPTVAVNKLNLLKTFISDKNSNLIKAVNINPTKGQITSGGTDVNALRAKYNY